MSLITTTEELRLYCHNYLEPSGLLFLDTEFIRERTYYAQLCLIQVAGVDGEPVAIDPLAEGIDLTPLLDVLYDPSKTKILHAARQDIEIFVQLTGEVPLPLFDTQMAAMILGMGEQLGYEAMVGQLLNRKINKSQQFTDWSRRPLSPPQIEYALDDVRHLRDCYPLLIDQLQETGRNAWLSEESRAIQECDYYLNDPEAAWLRLKKRNQGPHYLARLQALAKWREEEAMAQNKPRRRILGDDSLQEIALTNPKDIEQMQRIRGLPRGKAVAQALLEAVAAANALSATDCPSLPEKITLSKDEELQRDMLKVLLKHKANQHQVSPTLLCSQTAMTQLIQRHDTSPVLHGWRYELFGADALRLLAGELWLRMNAGDLEVHSSL